MSMQRSSVPQREVRYAGARRAPNQTEPALRVATVYEDPLTRYWAAELWDRVGRLVGEGDICHQSWLINNLTAARTFTDAVEAAAKADVLIVAVRDAGELPAKLCAWIDAWVPQRFGRPGALVAVIGVPSEPDNQYGLVHQYLDSVTRKAGLDFLPRERKLPKESSARSGCRTTLKPKLAMLWPGGAPMRVAEAPVRQRRSK